jgi:hypothetical protein
LEKAPREICTFLASQDSLINSQTDPGVSKARNDRDWCSGIHQNRDMANVL